MTNHMKVSQSSPYWNIITNLSKRSGNYTYAPRHFSINLLTPNDTYRGRTAPLTSKVSFYIFIQQI